MPVHGWNLLSSCNTNTHFYLFHTVPFLFDGAPWESNATGSDTCDLQLLPQRGKIKQRVGMCLDSAPASTPLLPCWGVRDGAGWITKCEGLYLAVILHLLAGPAFTPAVPYGTDRLGRK